jgi:hypothetical protein
MFPCPSFCENLPPKKQIVPKSKLKVSALNLSDKVKIRFVERWHVFSGSWVALWEE